MLSSDAVKTKLFQDPRRRNAAAGLFEVAAHRLGNVLQLDRLIVDQAELHGVVTVRAAGRFLLHDDARPSLDDRHRSYRAVRREDLRHADFSSDDSVNHDQLFDSLTRFGH